MEHLAVWSTIFLRSGLYSEDTTGSSFCMSAHENTVMYWVHLSEEKRLIHDDGLNTDISFLRYLPLLTVVQIFVASYFQIEFSLENCGKWSFFFSRKAEVFWQIQWHFAQGHIVFSFFPVDVYLIDSKCRLQCGLCSSGSTLSSSNRNTHYFFTAAMLCLNPDEELFLH